MCCWRFIPFFWLFSTGSGLIQRNYLNIPKIENSLSRSTKLSYGALRKVGLKLHYVQIHPSEWSKPQILSGAFTTLASLPPASSPKATVLRTSALWSNYNFDNDNPLVLKIIERTKRSLELVVEKLCLSDKKKIDAWINITRIKSNFLPISILVGLSGYIADKTAIFSVPFIGAFSVVHMTSALSMVINDLYDIEADRINHCDRPLVQGTISETEAVLFVVTMVMAIPAVGYYMLPSYVAPIWLGATGIVLSYSSVLKKILFIKNMACALVVSSTVPFVALSIANPLPNLHWIQLTSQTLFMASLYIELLLDITDIRGDEENGVSTLPVVFGKDATLGFVSGIVSVGWINMLNDLYTHRVPAPVFAGITLAYAPFYLNLWRIWRTNGSKSMVDNAIHQTTISLIIYFASIIILQ